MFFPRQIKFSRTFKNSPVYSSTFQACANPVEIEHLGQNMKFCNLSYILDTICHDNPKFASVIIFPANRLSVCCACKK